MSAIEYEESLFRSIASLICEQQQASNKDRRENERHAYRCIQLIAPYDGKHLPEQHDFRQVMCHDLSPHGFSYRSTEYPDMSQLVVALGRIPFKFLVAEIVRSTPMVTEHGSELQIGCRFVRRITGE